MPEVLSRASMLLKMDSRLRGNDDYEYTVYYANLSIYFGG